MAITTHDLNLLIREPSPRVRSHIAAKVSADFNRSNFTGNENKLAIEIFRLLLRDTSTSVRRAIAENLKSSRQVPRDIVLALARDELEIAIPVIECSEILTDDDLIELIGASQELRRLLAVSRRKRVSRRVGLSLLATHHHEIVVSLLGNPGATLAEEDLEGLLSEFEGVDEVLEALVFRGGLSVRFAEKLYTIVSAQLIRQLTRRYRLPRALAGQQVENMRESAILRFLSACMSDRDLLDLAEAMHKGRRLKDGFIIRTLAAGEMAFFEAALSVRAALPLANVRKLLHDRGGLGFRTLCLSASLPEDWIQALWVVAQFWHKEQSFPGHRAQKEARLLEFLRTSGYDAKIAYMPALIELIARQMPDARILH